jgi:hypothetical protein
VVTGKEKEATVAPMVGAGGVRVWQESVSIIRAMIHSPDDGGIKHL